MNFEEIEIELSNGLAAHVSGEYDIGEVEAGFPNSPDCGWAWAARNIFISKAHIYKDGETYLGEFDGDNNREVYDKLEAHLNKELEEYEP